MRKLFRGATISSISLVEFSRNVSDIAKQSASGLNEHGVYTHSLR